MRTTQKKNQRNGLCNTGRYPCAPIVKHAGQCTKWCVQHTATHCNTLQHTATHCNTLQHTAAHCNTLQHTATHTARSGACIVAACGHLQTCVDACTFVCHCIPFVLLNKPNISFFLIQSNAGYISGIWHFSKLREAQFCRTNFKILT